jgi:hypothetical protein
MAGKSSALHPDLLDSTYLKRYAWPHSYLQDRLPTAAKIIVVIPCYQEPDILRTFQSLEACTGHRGNVAVLVVVNHGEHESEAIKAYNVQSCEALEVWMKAKRKLQYHLIRAFDLPSKKAGVGLARKIGMDEAVRTFHGNEIVANTRRLCLMNMFLHNIGEIDGTSFISSADALVSDEGIRYDYVLANPPFGKKSSMTSTNEQGMLEKQDLSYNRQDFWASTSNKQLNFLQHIRTLLKINGEAAVVLPDNVLFEGGAGETVRKELLKTTELHTILRLPTGIFYAQGVKANVLFFNNKPASKDPWTKEVWIYDYRTNIHHTLKKNPLKLEDLRDFITLYNPSNRNKRKETWSEENPEGRWRKFSYEEIIARDKTNLDIFRLKDKSLADLDNLPDPDILANEIIENIEAGLESFKDIVEVLNGGK